jgi:hypothetical protein
MSVNSRKKDDLRVGGNGARVKLRWMELDVEGGTTDLVEGFKSFAAELRGAGGRLPSRALAAAKPNGATSATAVIDDSPAEQQENLLDATDIEVADKGPPETITDLEADNRKRRPAPRAPKFLSDLDLNLPALRLYSVGRAGNTNPFSRKQRSLSVCATGSARPAG